MAYGDELRAYLQGLPSLTAEQEAALILLLVASATTEPDVRLILAYAAVRLLLPDAEYPAADPELGVLQT